MAKKAPKAQVPHVRRPVDGVLVTAAGLAAIQVAIVWLPSVPLGVPGEWTWDRIPYGGPEAATLFLRMFAVLPAMALYVAICFAGETRISSAERSHASLWLLALTVAGFGMLWTVRDAPTNAYDRLGRDPLVLYFPSTSGYFTEARDAVDFAHYLAEYEQLMSRGDVLHLGTHPPGLIALHRGLLAIYERSPMLVETTLALRPESVRQTQDLITAIAQSEGKPLSQAELAELWGAALLIQLAGAAAVVPLYLCAKQSAGAIAGWRVACLWPLVPALAIFLPKSDAFYPLVVMAFLACWYRRSDAAGIGSSVIAGTLLWIGMTLSLAVLPAALLASLLSAQSVIATEPANRRHAALLLARNAATVTAVFAALTTACYFVLDIDLVSVWRWNYQNHAGFYDQFQRTYWKWLLVNPIELAMAVGFPVVVGTIIGCKRKPIATSVALPIGVVLGLLWISGKNSGEAARLWLFLMPWLLWIAAYCWSAEGARRRWRTILILQAVVGFLMSVRIGGFGFAEMIREFG